MVGVTPAVSQKRKCVFDDSNVDEAGDPPEYGVGYGDQRRDGFLEAWNLSG